VSRYARHRQEVPENSVVTVNGDLRTLRRILHLAVEWAGWTVCPPFTNCRSQGPGPRFELCGRGKVSGEGFRQSEGRGQFWRSIPGCALTVELFPLRWADVDLTARAECPHGALHVRQGKTDSAQRSLPSLPALLRFYSAARGRQRESQTRLRSCFRVTHFGAHRFHAASARKGNRGCGLVSFEFYCWRHTFGTRAAQSGMDRFTLARLMGHSSPSVAARYYIHVTEHTLPPGSGNLSSTRRAT